MAGHLGYLKGMTQGGVDLDRVFTEHAALAKEAAMEEVRNDQVALLGYGVAEFAKLTARTALAMVKDLEERISRIEDKGVVYRGVYNQSDSYTRGDLVTCGGSIFHCTQPTIGLSPSHAGGERKELDHPWQLAVRRGRDSK